MRIYIGTVDSIRENKTLIPSKGRKTSESDNEIRKQVMLSSGKTVVDVVATKKIFTFFYNYITGSDAEVWRPFIGSETWELEIERRDGTFNMYHVRLSPENQKTYRWTWGDWLYENVSFVLEEI